MRQHIPGHLRDVGEYYPYFQTREFMLGKQRVGPGVKFVEMYAPYADGLKTGFICSSGFNIVGMKLMDEPEAETPPTA